VARADVVQYVRFAGNARDVVVVIDAEGTIQVVSQSAEAILGYQPADVAQRNVAEFLHPDDVVGAAIRLLSAEEMTGSAANVDVRIEHADGHYVAFEFLPLNLLATDGVIVLTGRDVTERHVLDAERAVHQSRFRAVAQSAPIAIFLIAADGQCVFVNDRWTDLTGQLLEDAAGPGWITVIHRRDQLKLAAIRDGLVGSGGTM
jgi:PAS domain S-box-containing protein